MPRITMKDLTNKLERLNELSPYSYRISKRNDYIALDEMDSGGTRIASVICCGTMRDIDNVLYGMITSLISTKHLWSK